MPISFYFHTEVEDMNERRALYRVARLLDQRFRPKTAQHVALIANVKPKRTAQMTQLDALILAENTVALVEFKNNPDPFDGSDPDGYWMIDDTDFYVSGGSSINPYRQAQRAHERWRAFFVRNMDKVVPDAHRQKNLNWHHLNGYVLFHPYLHERSRERLMHPGKDHLWLSFGSIDEVLQFMFTGRPDLRLTPHEIETFARGVFKGQPWHELVDLLREFVGYVKVEQPNGPPIAYPLLAYDDLTIGRSHHNRIIIPEAFGHASSHHLRLVTQKKSVMAIDLNSTHGSFLDGEPFDKLLLYDGAQVMLGGLEGPTVAKLTFSRESPAGVRRGSTNPTLP